MKIKVKRICAGEYECTNGDKTVSISRLHFWDGPGWIAAATWRQDTYTDPLRTKRDAVYNAKLMLEEAA